MQIQVKAAKAGLEATVEYDGGVDTQLDVHIHQLACMYGAHWLGSGCSFKGARTRTIQVGFFTNFDRAAQFSAAVRGLRQEDDALSVQLLALAYRWESDAQGEGIGTQGEKELCRKHAADLRQVLAALPKETCRTSCRCV